MNKIILSSVIVLGLSGAAFAQAATPDFASVDADASGGVSWTEAYAAWPTLTEDAFKAADTDASGELSAEEYAAVTTPAQ